MPVVRRPVASKCAGVADPEHRVAEAAVVLGEASHLAGGAGEVRGDGFPGEGLDLSCWRCVVVSVVIRIRYPCGRHYCSNHCKPGTNQRSVAICRLICCRNRQPYILLRNPLEQHHPQRHQRYQYFLPTGDRIACPNHCIRFLATKHRGPSSNVRRHPKRDPCRVCCISHPRNTRCSMPFMWYYLQSQRGSRNNMARPRHNYMKDKLLKAANRRRKTPPKPGGKR